MATLRSICALLLLALLGSSIAFSQLSKHTACTVTDVSAAVVGNAKVTITEINTGVKLHRRNQ